MFKRLLSMMLVAIMLTGLLPLEVYAAQKNPETKMDPGDVTIEGTNGFGTLLSAELEEKIDQTTGTSENEINYSVTGLTIEGNTATVEYSSQEDAVLVVALYTEDGLQMLASGRTAVSAEDTTVNVTIEGELPQYFQAQAYLMDNYDLSPLCAAYHTPIYTRAMQELLASTVDDYEADRVLNLDENENTNFAVYAEGTIILEADGSANDLRSAEDGVYVFENADAILTGLTVGDVFAYARSAEDILIVKVGTISVQGDTVTITEDADLAMEEVFEAVKIESEGDTLDITVDDSTADEGITYVGEVVDGDISTFAAEDNMNKTYAKRFAISLGKKSPSVNGGPSNSVKISGSLLLSINIRLKYYLSATTQLLELSLSPRATFSLEIVEKVKLSGKLGSLGFTPLPCVFIGFEPEVQIEYSGKLNFSAIVMATIGFHFDNVVGIQNISEWPTVETEAKISGTLFIGLNLSPGMEILDDEVASLTLETLIGGRIKGTPSGYEYVEQDENSSIHHACADCVDMDLEFVGKLAGELKILDLKSLSYDITFGEWTSHIGKMYYSNSMHEFGFGTCPYYTYRVTVELVDKDGRPVPRTDIEVSTLDKPLMTDDKGTAVFYSAPEEIIFRAKEMNYSAFKQVWINGPQKVKLQLEPVSKPENPGDDDEPEYDWGDIGGIFGDIETEDFVDQGDAIASGKCGDDAYWSLYDNGLLKIYGSGEMYDYNFDERPAPWYEQHFSEVIIGGNVTSIGEDAFAWCNWLDKFTIGNTVTTIGAGAFYACYFMAANINIPASVTFIGESAFNELWASAHFIVDPDNQYYSSDAHGGLYDKNKTVLFHAPGDFVGVYTVPESVTTIGDSAFEECTGMTSINLPDSITSIGRNAFFHCWGLKSIRIPEGVSEIADGTFTNCFDLTDITLPDSLVTIGHHAFFDCNELSEIRIPANVQSIGVGAFGQCFALTEIDLPDSLVTIGGGAFESCRELSEIHIPASVQSIGAGAFNCPARLYVDPANLYFSSDSEGVLFDKNKTRLMRANGITCKSYSIPNGVTTIDSSAFSNCTELQNVMIPDGVTTIAQETFEYCTNLQSITIPGSVTLIANYAFYACSSLNEVHYKGAKTQWEAILINYGNDDLLDVYKIYFEGPEGTENLGDLLFSEQYTDTIRWELYSTGVLRLTGSGEMIEPKYSFLPWYNYRNQITQILIEEGITSICNDAFSSCSKLTSVSIPVSVTSIGDKAFYDTALTSVDIPNGVTYIGEEAFRYCDQLTSVIVPKSVVEMGNSVFMNCEDLTTVTILGNVTAIGKTVFHGCTRLTAVDLPDSVERIGESAFGLCYDLTEIDLPKNLLTIDYGAFQLSGLVSIDIPNRVETIGEFAFSSCHDLTNVVLSENITEIKAQTFSFCESLINIYIPSGVISVGEEAFKKCVSLTSTNLPDSVTALGKSAFSGCIGLTDIDVPTGVHTLNGTFINCTGLVSITIPDHVTEIGTSAFEGCTSLTDILIGNGVSNIGSGAFKNCTSLVSIEIPQSVQSIGSQAFEGCTSLTDILIEDGVSNIGLGAFRNCTSLVSIEIPQSVQSIGSQTFEDCTSLTDILIENGVSNIGSAAFRNCTSLASIELPDSIEAISYYTFENCISLTKIKLSASLTKISYHSFQNCSSLASVELYEGIEEIDEGAFENCVGLTEITLPKSLLSIGDDAFNGCTGLQTVYYKGTEAQWDNRIYFGSGNDVLHTNVISLDDIGVTESWNLSDDGVLVISGSGRMANYDRRYNIHAPWYDRRDEIIKIVIEDGIITIGDSAFCECSNLTAVEIPDSVTSIGDSAFYACENLTAIQIPDSVTSIGDRAFYDCEELTTANLPTGISTISNSIFYRCSLTEINIPDSVTLIGDSAFCYCNLTEIEIPDSVTRIGRYAFSNCRSLTTVVIPNVVTIDTQAFYNCNRLAEVDISDGLATIGDKAFYGTALTSIDLPDSVITIGSYAFAYTELEQITLSEGLTAIGEYAFCNCNALTSIEIPASVTTWGKYAFLYCDQLVDVVLSEGLTSIGEDAFYGCNALTRIEIPASITNWGNSPFDYCDNLSEVILSEGLTTIGKMAFYSCDALTSIKIPASVTTWGDYAFTHCNQLNEVILSDGLSSIGADAFSSCKALTTIEIPASVTTWGKNAFAHCDQLVDVIFSDGLTVIGENAFSNCSSVISVKLPDSLTSIGRYAFSYCSALADIEIPVGLTWIGGQAFSYCTALQNVYYNGTREQWDAITVENGNDALFNAYNNTVGATAIEPIVLSETFLSGITPFAVYPGDYETEDRGDHVVKTASFEHLVPGKPYILLAFKTLDTDDLLSADNLLYICQSTAAENGTLSFRYIQREDIRSYVMACGASNKDLIDAEITFPEMVGDGTLHVIAPVVIYDGKTLIEGKDYVITGQVDYTKAGTYECWIRGIYSYTGLLKCTYTVLPADYVVTFDLSLSSFSLTNETGKTADIQFMAAAYDRNGCMLVSDSFTRSLTDGESVEWQLTCPEGAEIRWVRAFVLDPDTMQPLCVKKSWTVQAVR